MTPESGSLPAEGGELTLHVDTNAGEWTYTATGSDGSWLVEKSKDRTSLVLTASRNERFSIRKATVRVSVPDYPDLNREIEVTQSGFTADLLDIVFNNDGTAVDISPMHNPVVHSAGPSLMTYYNDSYGR